MSVSSSIVPNLPVQSSTLPAEPAESTVARWVIEDREVRLLHQQNRLAFSVSVGGVEMERGDVPLTLYDINYALNLVTLFHRVIETNLRHGPITPSAFLPVLCTDALRLQNQRLTPDTNVKVALFGRVNVVTGDIIDIRFGVCNPSDNSVYAINVDEQAKTTREFLLKAPRYNRPQADEQSPHHYEMNRHAKGFRPVITYSPTGTIQAVAMQNISLINRDVVIDENNWAVTLVSAQRNSGFCLMSKSGSHGHAMIAYEGLEQGKRVLQYMHITTLPQLPMPNRKSYEAQIEFCKPPSHVLNGPTWTVSKARVQEMVRTVENAQSSFVKFSIPGALTAGLYEKWQQAERDKKFFKANKYSFLFTFTSMQLAALYGGEVPLRDIILNCQNCRDWCRDTLRSAGIQLIIPPTIVAPNTTIEYLNSHPSAALVMPEEPE